MIKLPVAKKQHGMGDLPVINPAGGWLQNSSPSGLIHSVGYYRGFHPQL